MDIKPLLNSAVALQSVALLSTNYNLAKKKKKKVSDFLAVGVGNIAGTSLIKSQSDFIMGIWKTNTKNG